LLGKSDLYGYPILGSDGRLIMTLFADDTTVYLDKRNNYEELLSILNLWCQASGARFNVNKTEIIPIGSPQYRNEFLETWRVMLENTCFDDNIRIAKEREPTRILGGWVGNGVDKEAIWSKNPDKIQTIFERWDQWHPTLISRQLIVNMFTRGITQYLTTIQGMPKEIETRLQKMISTLVWDG
ncbi:hypothetical protein PILCRDRAFT_40414, partial [Piloderma croceum F 1598]